MLRLLGLACLFLVGLSPAALAQDRITPEEFLSRALGKTLDFHSARTGALIGREYFANPDETIWLPNGGLCERGILSTPDGKLCFDYASRPEGKICWVPFQFEGRIFVREAQLMGAEIQEVRRISDEILNCDPAPMS